MAGLSIYARSGAMQLVADLVRPAGMGVASLELEYLRQRLEAEGLFDPHRKRPLPTAPRTIGVVTSTHGAAWHDIVAVIDRRFPLTELLLAPAQVQGDGAPESIVQALQSMLTEPRVDVIILARGGGATDDLSAFNDERVARAVFASPVPIVVGVGHATDRTLVEDVADLYAPTPSAAAELCVPSIEELQDDVHSLGARLIWAFSARHTDCKSAVHAVSRRLAALKPECEIARAQSGGRRVGEPFATVDDMRLTSEKQKLTATVGVLAALEPAAVLKRGYAAIQRAEDGRPVFSVAHVQSGTAIVTRLQDGALRSVVDGEAADHLANIGTAR
jgi:exodeoxyribonuclease VII large subunit